eukprot:CAMPEP_0171312272 /NCGR_PEP_ID=MMETSP0816-20121228/22563_1 /TAXON_ID=420281 /ORGANISM="Proboscia inermis, Strain CCAP1064/1" /LENGTH=92 /DNA_ID=CAMNT_0011797577 /DNA_START=721 /DNA_END=1000 /DNA_ORIENTATION=+
MVDTLSTGISPRSFGSGELSLTPTYPSKSSTSNSNINPSQAHGNQSRSLEEHWVWNTKLSMYVVISDDVKEAIRSLLRKKRVDPKRPIGADM